MNAKFETALFIDGNERKSYSTDEIAKIFNEISTYTYVKEQSLLPLLRKSKISSSLYKQTQLFFLASPLLTRQLLYRR